MSATTTKVYTAVDVSKGHLEVFVAPTGERFSVPNDDSGVDELLSLGSRNRVVPRWWCWKPLEASSDL